MNIGTEYRSFFKKRFRCIWQKNFFAASFIFFLIFLPKKSPQTFFPYRGNVINLVIIRILRDLLRYRPAGDLDRGLAAEVQIHQTT